MDLLTAEERRVQVAPALRQWPVIAGLAAYAVVVSITLARHEPWADEAQSWLLARDAGLVRLWTQLLHYEGTTGLWQTLLHGLILAGLPYSGMRAVAAAFGLAGAAVILWRAPFPVAIRLALPLSYFLCYQYAVIARSYDLLPLLVFGSAAWFDHAAERPLRFTFLLCLMAAVSIHGMILAASIGLAAIARSPARSRLLPYAAGFAAVTALLATAACPAADGTFVARLNFSFEHFVGVGGRAFAAAFTGETISSLVVVALSVPLLWRGGGLLFFALASGLLCSVYAVVYSQVWHFGVLFLAWIFAMWIAWRQVAAERHTLTRNLAGAALTVVLGVQCFWTSCAVRYDWNKAYSGSLEAARGLREMNFPGHPIYAIGYACVAIQPYFSGNLFSNWREAYWDWSKRNRINEDSLRLANPRPEYVIVGYKNDFERGVWTTQVLKSGYRAIRHYEGNSFWQTRVFEPESFDLYRRNDGR